MAYRNINLNLNMKVAGIAAYRNALNPAFLRQYIALENQLKAVTIDLNEALDKEQRLQGEVAEKAKTAADRQLEGLRSVNEALEQQADHLAKIKAQLDSSTLRRRVGLQLETEKAQGKLDFAESKERAKQLGPTKAIADLFGLGGGGHIGSFLKRAGGTVSGIGESIGGGLGGLLSKGGSLLGAFGPEIGIAVAGYTMLAKVTKGLAATPFKAVAGGMDQINKALSGLNSKLGPIDSLFGKMTGDLDKISNNTFVKYLNPVMAGVAEGLSEVFKQAQAFLHVSVDLAAKAQPGSAKRLAIAVDDAAAVVGQRLVPVVELITKVVRGIGDVLQTVLPSSRQFREALQPLGEAFDNIKTALLPTVAFLKFAFSNALAVLSVQLRAAAKAVEILTWPMRNLAKLAGLKLETSAGAAARNVSFSTPEDYANQVRIAAAMNGGESPSQRTANATEAMRQILEQIRDRLNAAGPAVAPIRNAIDVAAAGARAGWFGLPGQAAAALLGG